MNKGRFIAPLTDIYGGILNFVILAQNGKLITVPSHMVRRRVVDVEQEETERMVEFTADRNIINDALGKPVNDKDNVIEDQRRSAVAIKDVPDHIVQESMEQHIEANRNKNSSPNVVQPSSRPVKDNIISDSNSKLRLPGEVDNKSKIVVQIKDPAVTVRPPLESGTVPSRSPADNFIDKISRDNSEQECQQKQEINEQLPVKKRYRRKEISNIFKQSSNDSINNEEKKAVVQKVVPLLLKNHEESH